MCDGADCDRLLTIWYRSWEDDIRARFFDPTNDTFEDAFTLQQTSSIADHVALTYEARPRLR